MKKLLILFFSIVPILGYWDLGVIGKTYPIEETNIRKQIYDGLKKISPEQMKRDYLRSVNNAFTFKTNLPASKRDSSLDYQDITTVKFDIPNPNKPGYLLYKKGDKFISNIGNQIKFLCFIDASNTAIAKEVSREFGKCDYMVANADIRKMDYLGNNNIFPMTQAFIERFKIGQLPVRVIMYRDRISHQYLSVPRIIENLKRRSVKR